MYICECGKQFEDSQSFNGHKSNCFVHILKKYGNLDLYYQNHRASIQKAHKTQAENRSIKKEQQLQLWVSEQHTCERCGKVMTEKFGSGRFCSRACANARDHSEETKLKISAGLNKETACNCDFCGKEFKTLISKSSHESMCNKNPNYNETKANAGALANHNKKMLKNVIVGITENNNRVSVELDITNAELAEYRKLHSCCEICGKSFTNLSAENAKKHTYNLSIDHDHVTNKFRGLLCVTCNGNLGKLELGKNCDTWFNKYKDNIVAYLNKNI